MLGSRIIILLIGVLLLSCASTKTYGPDGEVTGKCRAWGTAKCWVCEPVLSVRLVSSTGEVFYIPGEVCLGAESEGLSDNGARAIIQTVLNLPPAILRAMLPF
jgi:hypothetical protein